MISLDDYLGKWMFHEDATPERKDNAAILLYRVNPLLDAAVADGVVLLDNPITKSQVSGATYGGFRPQSCPQGAPNSSHKEGMGVDIFDPYGDLDNWITDEILERFALYREAPSATDSWCHLTTRPPRSKRRTFFP